ncbi:MAG TPA: LysR substrate-binding domain-containing protein [Capillimicrobium sp.]
MELRHLRAFVAVAEELHFGRAAKRLHIAQPPLSQQIRRLEAELGVTLLHRSTRRVELAPAGQVLLARARELLADAEATVEDTRRAARGEFGRLAIGFTGSATYALLPSLAAALRERLPGVVLDLRGEMLTPAQVEGLADGSLDLALLRPPVEHPDLVVEVVRREPLVVAVPASHPLAQAPAIALEDLADEPFVLYPSHFRSVVHQAVAETCARHGFQPRCAVEASETSTLVSFVAAGVGVSLVPASVQRMTVAGAVYRPLARETVEVELAVARRRAATPVVERSLEVLRDHLPAA